jgi:hypothetical protein
MQKIFYNLLIEKPKRFSYNLVYNILKIMFNLKEFKDKVINNKENKLLIFKHTYNNIIKFLFVIIFGIPLFAIKNNNLICLKIITASKLKFKNYKSYLTFIMFNFTFLMLINVDKKSKIQKIIFKKKKIIFNPRKDDFIVFIKRLKNILESSDNNVLDAAIAFEYLQRNLSVTKINMPKIITNKNELIKNKTILHNSIL